MQFRRGFACVAHREASRRERHADEQLELVAGVGARGPRPAERLDLDVGDARAVVAQRDPEVVEVVLEAAAHEPGLGVDEPDAPPVRPVRVHRPVLRSWMRRSR